MDASTELKQPLLIDEFNHRLSSRKDSRMVRILYLALVCLIFSNATLLYKNFFHKHTPTLERSRFAELTYNTTAVYQTWTNFQKSDVRDETWHNLDLTPIEVLLSDYEAVERGVDPSLFRFPWNRDLGVYYVKAFHDLHCLKVIKWVVENPSEEGLEHVYHCLDALRQDIMCSADDTPMPITTLPDTAGEGQVRTCRDFDALVRWTQHPSRFPCYKREVDWKLKDRIEAYAFCPENSPFYNISQAYFTKWGHTF